MTDTNQNLPLWRVLKEAYIAEDLAECDRHPDAAQIRALADWLVPESSCRPYAQTLYHEGCADTRLRLRNELLAEVDRAEAGE